MSDYTYIIIPTTTFLILNNYNEPSDKKFNICVARLVVPARIKRIIDYKNIKKDKNFDFLLKNKVTFYTYFYIKSKSIYFDNCMFGDIPKITSWYYYISQFYDIEYDNVNVLLNISNFELYKTNTRVAVPLQQKLKTLRSITSSNDIINVCNFFLIQLHDNPMFNINDYINNPKSSIVEFNKINSSFPSKFIFMEIANRLKNVHPNYVVKKTSIIKCKIPNVKFYVSVQNKNGPPTLTLLAAHTKHATSLKLDNSYFSTPNIDFVITQGENKYTLQSSQLPTFGNYLFNGQEIIKQPDNFDTWLFVNNPYKHKYELIVNDHVYKIVSVQYRNIIHDLNSIIKIRFWSLNIDQTRTEPTLTDITLIRGYVNVFNIASNKNVTRLEGGTGHEKMIYFDIDYEQTTKELGKLNNLDDGSEFRYSQIEHLPDIKQYIDNFIIEHKSNLRYKNLDDIKFTLKYEDNVRKLYVTVPDQLVTLLAGNSYIIPPKHYIILDYIYPLKYFYKNSVWSSPDIIDSGNIKMADTKFMRADNLYYCSLRDDKIINTRLKSQMTDGNIILENISMHNITYLYTQPKIQSKFLDSYTTYSSGCQVQLSITEYRTLAVQCDTIYYYLLLTKEQSETKTGLSPENLINLGKDFDSFCAGLYYEYYAPINKLQISDEFIDDSKIYEESIEYYNKFIDTSTESINYKELIKNIDERIEKETIRSKIIDRLKLEMLLLKNDPTKARQTDEEAIQYFDKLMKIASGELSNESFDPNVNYEPTINLVNKYINEMDPNLYTLKQEKISLLIQKDEELQENIKKNKKYNFEVAMKLYHKAAEEGNPLAIEKLISYYGDINENDKISELKSYKPRPNPFANINEPIRFITRNVDGKIIEESVVDPFFRAYKIFNDSNPETNKYLYGLFAYIMLCVKSWGFENLFQWDGTKYELIQYSQNIILDPLFTPYNLNYYITKQHFRLDISIDLNTLTPVITETVTNEPVCVTKDGHPQYFVVNYPNIDGSLNKSESKTINIKFNGHLRIFYKILDEKFIEYPSYEDDDRIITSNELMTTIQIYSDSNSDVKITRGSNKPRVIFENLTREQQVLYHGCEYTLENKKADQEYAVNTSSLTNIVAIHNDVKKYLSLYDEEKTIIFNGEFKVSTLPHAAPANRKYIYGSVLDSFIKLSTDSYIGNYEPYEKYFDSVKHSFIDKDINNYIFEYNNNILTIKDYISLKDYTDKYLISKKRYRPVKVILQENLLLYSRFKENNSQTIKVPKSLDIDDICKKYVSYKELLYYRNKFENLLCADVPKYDPDLEYNYKDLFCIVVSRYISMIQNIQETSIQDTDHLNIFVNDFFSGNFKKYNEPKAKEIYDAVIANHNQFWLSLLFCSYQNVHFYNPLNITSKLLFIKKLIKDDYDSIFKILKIEGDALPKEYVPELIDLSTPSAKNIIKYVKDYFYEAAKNSIRVTNDFSARRIAIDGFTMDEQLLKDYTNEILIKDMYYASDTDIRDAVQDYISTTLIRDVNPNIKISVEKLKYTGSIKEDEAGYIYLTDSEINMVKDKYGLSPYNICYKLKDTDKLKQIIKEYDIDDFKEEWLWYVHQLPDENFNVKIQEKIIEYISIVDGDISQISITILLLFNDAYLNKFDKTRNIKHFGKFTYKEIMNKSFNTDTFEKIVNDIVYKDYINEIDFDSLIFRLLPTGNGENVMYHFETNVNGTLVTISYVENNTQIQDYINSRPLDQKNLVIKYDLLKNIVTNDYLDNIRNTIIKERIADDIYIEFNGLNAALKKKSDTSYNHEIYNKKEKLPENKRMTPTEVLTYDPSLKDFVDVVLGERNSSNIYFYYEDGILHAYRDEIFSNSLKENIQNYLNLYQMGKSQLSLVDIINKQFFQTFNFDSNISIFIKKLRNKIIGDMVILIQLLDIEIKRQDVTGPFKSYINSVKFMCNDLMRYIPEDINTFIDKYVKYGLTTNCVKEYKTIKNNINEFNLSGAIFEPFALILYDDVDFGEYASIFCDNTYDMLAGFNVQIQNIIGSQILSDENITLETKLRKLYLEEDDSAPKVMLRTYLTSTSPFTFGAHGTRVDKSYTSNILNLNFTQEFKHVYKTDYFFKMWVDSTNYIINFNSVFGVSIATYDSVKILGLLGLTIFISMCIYKDTTQIQNIGDCEYNITRFLKERGWPNQVSFKIPHFIHVKANENMGQPAYVRIVYTSQTIPVSKFVHKFLERLPLKDIDILNTRRINLIDAIFRIVYSKEILID